VEEDALKVYVKTPCRLHFSLIDMSGSVGRVDGSVGLALNYPNVTLEAQSDETLRVEGLTPRKVRTLVKRFMKHFNLKEGVRVNLRSNIPSHVGLGSTTQLSMAIASALAELFNVERDVNYLARVMGRGGTSGIGVAAFHRGGFILDGGHLYGKKGGKRSFLPSHASRAPPPPILLRYDFPEDWMFVIALPNLPKGLHGPREVEVFQSRCPIPDVEVGKVCRLILMKMLPALKEQDIEEFGSSLTQLQEVGFAAATKDFMHPTVKRCVKLMLKLGAYGAGQSSFGPNAYALVKGVSQARKIMRITNDFLQRTGGGEVFYTSANNRGATVKLLK